MARKAIQNDRYRLAGSYERLRRALLDLPNDGRLDKPLSYWVIPTDRRLPIAFLDSPLRDLLAMPLEELMATPGVGQKKILGFFDLLRRAAKAPLNDAPFGFPSAPPPSDPNPRGAFDPSSVSEAVWSTWCETVRHSGLAREKLGRLAPSLQALPTVIWHSRLNDYANLSLAEIRGLKTHGEKRVAAILEVFCIVHEAVSTAALHENLDIQLTPRFVPELSRWITEVVWDASLPQATEVQNRLVAPLIRQTEIDLGEQVGRLASDRLRAGGAPAVKDQADALGVTRARVYQLLDDCARAMEVRWPEGRWLLSPLADRCADADADTIDLINATRDLFFPDERQLPSLSGGSSVTSAAKT